MTNPDRVRIQQGVSLLDLKRNVGARGYGGIGYGKLTIADLIERAPVMVATTLFHDPPWTTPLLRRNEVAVPVMDG